MMMMMVMVMMMAFPAFCGNGKFVKPVPEIPLVQKFTYQKTGCGHMTEYHVQSHSTTPLPHSTDAAAPT